MLMSYEVIIIVGVVFIIFFIVNTTIIWCNEYNQFYLFIFFF